MSKQPIIQVHNLVKKFGDFVANDHLSFQVNRGEIFGFLGPNGAGKTTAIKILCGLWKPSAGDIRVAGYNVYHETEKIKQTIGYMSQRFSLYEDLSVSENIRFYGGIYGLSRNTIQKRAEELLERLDLTHARDKLIQELPLGWRQKLAFSVAMLHRPAIVFLDEPTSGVDPLIRRQFWRMIYESAHQGLTVFVTTHYMDEAEYCHRISIMARGKIKAIDSPEKIKARCGVDNMHAAFIKLTRAD